MCAYFIFPITFSLSSSHACYPLLTRLITTNVFQFFQTPSIVARSTPQKIPVTHHMCQRHLEKKQKLCIHTNTGDYWIVKRIVNELQQQQQQQQQQIITIYYGTR